MDKFIKGKVYVLGDNIDTDQIIPAQYLTYNPTIPAERRMFGRFAMSSVPLPEAGLPKGNMPFIDLTDPENTKSQYTIVIAGKNFGCGSSREHAPLAMAEAGIKAVVAEFYSRIFYRNAVNGGYLIAFDSPQRLVEKFNTGDQAEIDLETSTIKNLTQKTEFKLAPLGDVVPIIEAGGLFPFARKAGMI
jgi:3-isopropylmalate/(R)-2-methylmalate dehydratase small subunit